MDTLSLAPDLMEAIIDHALTCYPEEACGLLGGAGARATRLYVVENILHGSEAYEMEPRQQIKAMLAIEDEGLELVAIFHSHPHGPARPSTTDIAQACYPKSAQIVVSLADRQQPDVRAFVIQGGKATAIGLTTTS
ncbi:MAG TPA: M67 family metallopeptidase [Promineifilum sp.]|nr:M67 family metallopeptidase [Promineifilum sp.]